MVRPIIVIAIAVVFASNARAQAPAQDAVLRKLLEEAAAASPEVAQARASVEAEGARIPQAGALPDPSLMLGIQNDGFKRIAIGSAETSYFLIQATQAFPFPGKRGLREQVANLEQLRAEARLARVALSLEAEVRLAYLASLLAREQLALLGELQSFWLQADAAARARYESGQAPQSDLLRAKLERASLEQRRWLLEADVANRLAAINRLRVRPLDEPLATPARINGLGDPAAGPLELAVQDAEERSPELRLAQLGFDQAGRRVELARKELFPDFSVSAAVMPRGSMEPMWQVGLSVSVPLWAHRKQRKAIDENQVRQVAEAQGQEAIRQVLRLRVRERMTLLAALVRSNQQYRDSLLPLADATTRSTLAQYEVGRLPFAAVLEALGSYVANRGSALASIAEAWRVVIAQREVSLEPMAGGAGGTASASVPGAGAQGRAMGGAAPSAQGEAASEGVAQGKSGM